MRHPRTSKPVSFVRGIRPTCFLYNNDLLSESITDVICGYQLNGSGQLWVTDTNGTYYRPGAAQDWLKAGVPSQFEVYAKLVGGAITGSAPTDTWLSLGSTREWYVLALDTTIAYANLIIMIRPIGEITPRWQCHITLTADATL